MPKYPQPLVSAAWLLEHIRDNDVRVFDATYHMPATGRSASNEFPLKHLPYAQFFDIDAIADQHAALPHMLPSPAAFAQAVEAMSMGSDHFAVVYDVHGLMSAARLWWMFRVFGHDRVAVLDGGLPAWIAAGGKIEAGPARVRPGAARFDASYRPELVFDRDGMAAAVAAGDAKIIDARSAARFQGKAPEPRPGVRQGHIPGSASIPYTELLDERGLLLDPEALQRRFSQAGVAGSGRIVSSCGSGVTACVLALGLAVLGNDAVPVYDGSWNEWGGDSHCPVEL